MSLHRQCGALVIGGFAGDSLPRSFAARLESGELGGAILFARNLTPDLAQVAALNASIVRACGGDLPPIVSIDQEGGRVARLKEPVLKLPPALSLGKLDEAMIERTARVLGNQLAALGFSMDYAPVLDVHTNPDNPVIGDRAFATDPAHAARAALAFARGLDAAGVASCGKHFPGHGDTRTDSHLELPHVAHDRARLDAIELAPFAIAARTLPALMSAHVVYEAIDTLPATLSSRIATDLLRTELGFRGVLVSDDLEMRAIADAYGPGEAAVLAIEAGCDALLVCSSEDAQSLVVEALSARCERDARFRARCDEAGARVRTLREKYRARCASADVLEAALRVPDDVRDALGAIT